ncbi:uncharacterized protein TNCV_4459501 [Trichonephila clavipes]|nr:uncharacterized protein TNCV_4459501 [Trichonephila clavipes]
MYSAFEAGVTLNSRTAARPLVRLVEGEERWEAPGHPQGFLPLNRGGTEQNRSVSCMVLKAKVNNRRKILALSRDEFRGPRSDFVRQIVRVHYFVRGGFVGYRSRASSKHLSPHLPVGSLDSSGVKQGLRCIGSCTCGRRIYKETDTRCCCCFRDVTLQLSPSLMELFR